MNARIARTVPGIAVLLVPGLAGCTDVASPTLPVASGVTAVSTSLVSDSFTRTVSAGWGTADVGGPWRIDANVLSSFRVNGTRGLIVAPSNRPRNAIATDGYGLDIAGLVSFAIDRIPDNTTRFYTVQVYARRDDRLSDGDNYFRYRVRAFGTGKMDLRIEKNVRATRTWLSDGVRIAAIWRPSQRYWVRWECVGSSPSIMIRMRVWPDGTAEPTTWQIEKAVSEPLLDVAGTTGVRVEGPNADQTHFPITFSFDDLQYAGLD